MSRLLPSSLRQFELALEEYRVGEIHFSGATYQVQIFDRQKEYWVFLQLDEECELKDSFCSCEDSEVHKVCPHIAKSYKSLFSKEGNPLHLECKASFWNRYFSLCHAQFSDLEYPIEVNQERLVFEGKTFQIEAKSQKVFDDLYALFFERGLETEETSLKFSNLPLEELERWRSGNPSPSFAFLLSFWNDLAQYLFLFTNQHAFQTTYSADLETRLPTRISIESVSMKGTFELEPEVLSLLVPFLPDIHFPLPVLDLTLEGIDGIRFDENKLVLHIDSKSVPECDLDGIFVGRWIYFPDSKFVPKEKDSFFDREQVPTDEIERAFTSHFDILKKRLKEYPTSNVARDVKRHFSFTSTWDLQVTPFVKEVGDLSKGNAHFFGRWVYQKGVGFFPTLEEVRALLIRKEDVGEWIEENRQLIEEGVGFAFHPCGIEQPLTYTLSEGGELSFFLENPVEMENQLSCDFGRWIYIQGMGFYAKHKDNFGLPIRDGTVVNPAQVPFFLKMYREELGAIPNFFASKSPVLASGVNVTIDIKKNIYVTAAYEFHPGYTEDRVRFFDSWTFVQGEGFFQIPSNRRLPERYQTPIVVSLENLDAFVLHELESIRPHLFTIDKQLRTPERVKLVVDQLKPGTVGYLAELHYESEHGHCPFPLFWDGYLSKARFFLSPAGLIDTERERFHWIGSLHKGRVSVAEQFVELSILDLIKLAAFEEVEVKEGFDLWEEVLSFHVDDYPDATSLKSILRPYQEIGLRWLWFLYRHGLSGILSDEMGLGKTHQAMALLAAVSKESPGGRFLVICPTSVVYHWQEKLAQYFPSLKVCVYHGVVRELFEEYDLLLTSYGLWRSEVERLQKLSFDVAIFDEIQVAKNQTSLLFKTLQKVTAKVRLGLTGTPIENRIRELKSLFDLVLPGYMPKETDYRNFFVRPIEKEGDFERKELLSRVIRPFILRRKKEDVLLDLPEKIIEIAHCDLSDEQRSLYNDIVLRTKGSLLNELQDPNSSVPYMHVFAALSSLKQICNHPASYLKVPREYKEHTSGKWDLFIELLAEARESGQKVVVFSQFLAMLDIMEEYLRDHSIGFATIRGGTVDRGKELARFSSDPSCEVFLGSLQAAGLGIDLTAASVLIHYDRWWNDARESQATDRVHRIGQTRGVQVFKCVSKHTLEERIDQMIEQKRRLMEEVIGVDDHRVLKKFSREELLELFTEI